MEIIELKTELIFVFVVDVASYVSLKLGEIMSSTYSGIKQEISNKVRQEDLCEVEVSLIYIVNSRTT